MSGIRVHYHHDPRSSFPLPQNKRMRTHEFAAINPTTGPPPPPQYMNQVMFASRPSYFPVTPSLPQVGQYPVPGPQPGYANATTTPPGPVWRGYNGVVMPRTGPVLSGHVHADVAAAMCPVPNMNSQNGASVMPIEIQQQINSLFERVISQQSRTTTTTTTTTTKELLPSPMEQQTPPAQDDSSSIGLEFDPAKLNIRHESVIKSLYADLPRQCMTCGMRFKTQEEHRQHMDRHVRKNRDAKKSKQKKQLVSRKYYLTNKLWLTAADLATATAVGPAFSDPVGEEKKHEVSCEVLADESQKECPLCMEPFDEYFSDKRNDWMYREAVCYNPAKIPTRQSYKSLIGRIVHVKCVST